MLIFQGVGNSGLVSAIYLAMDQGFLQKTLFFCLVHVEDILQKLMEEILLRI